MAVYGTVPTQESQERERTPSWILPAVTIFAAAVIATTAVVLIVATPGPVELRQHSLANNYRSSNEARNELNAYFDGQSFATKRHGLSSSQAKQQLNQIFQVGSDHKMAKLRSLQQKQVMQDLAFSSHDADADLDSYFDSMNEGHPHHAHHEAAEARRSWGANAAEDDMDSYWDNMQAKEANHHWHHHSHKPTQKQIAIAKKLALDAYKKENPEFAKKLDQIHIDWMKNHDQPPTGTIEKEQYERKVKEVEKGAKLDVQKYMKQVMAGHTSAEADESGSMRKEALKKYLDQHPEVKAKMVKAKKMWMEEYGAPPKGAVQNKKYHDLMKKYVGHIDVSIKDELGLKKSAKEVTPEDKVKALKTYEKQNPLIKEKIAKVHKMWAAKHSHPPANEQEEAEYGELMKKYVVPTVATLNMAQAESKGK